MNNTGELFLRCNNLTLDQYKLIALSRGLTGAVGFAVSLVVLVVILLAARRRAWETLSKRFFFVTILCTAAYCVVAATGVHYTRPPSQEAAWCEAMGFVLHYTGSLVITSYMILVTALALQVFVPVFPALQTRMERTFSNRKLWEVILFLGCFLFPILITVEPFIFPLDPYGNYGPLCWFRLEMDENCTYQHSDLLNKDEHLLWTLPFTVMSLLLCTLVFSITVILCFLYCKFRKTKTGSHIVKAIRQTVTLTIAAFVFVAWFTQFLFQNIEQSKTFSSWTENVTTTPITAIGILLLVALYVHFPLRLLYNCCKKSMPKLHVNTERATVPSSQWDHRNVPSVTVTHICHETVTASETSRLINEQPNYQTFTIQ